MRVLFLPDYRAANAYQRALAAGLADLGVEVRADPTRAHRVAPISEALWRHGRPDIIHVHWTEPYIAGGSRVSRVKARRTILELHLARRAGIGIVWTAHDLFRHDRREDPTERAFMGSLFGLADAVIVHCEAAAEALLAALDVAPERRGKVSVIPHGHYRGAYPDDITPAAARARLGLPAGARVVVFAGWVRAYKGVAELVAAFTALDDPEARLVIAGQAVDGAYADRLTAMTRTDSRISLALGFVPDEELQVYLRAADVVATPFLEILTSGSVLLAMSFERAVIAPRRGCVAETLDEAGGILYDADDPHGLEEALRVAMSADLEAMGRRNAERLALFEWSRIADATRLVYEDVLKARAR
ncbi:MAG TPA: glycosyltransferase [Candidatus Limnocylindrales bacterium]|nr:glycosyltransferase [Candidatus Limnocylindrales bacterium]